MALAGIINEEKFGSQARPANEMIERLTSIEWFKNAGNIDFTAEEKFEQFMSSLNISEYKIKWIEKEQISEIIQRLTFEESTLWNELKQVPDQLKEKIVQTGNEKLLADLIDKVPEAVFHGAFKYAFDTFNEKEAIKFLVCQAMYVSVLVCSAELAGGNNPFTLIVELLEEGHLPLGPEGNTFYLL